MVITDAGTSTRHTQYLCLVSDDLAFRLVIRDMTSRHSDVVLGDECATAEAGLASVLAGGVDVVVVDGQMPTMKGFDWVRSIRAAGSNVRILLCRAQPAAELMNNLFSLGVHGYVDKGQLFGIMEHALGIVLSKGVFFASSLIPVLFGGVSQTHVSGSRTALTSASVVRPSTTLSPREREVAGMVASGLSSKEIAATLGVAVRTVESHRANLMAKIGVRDVATLTRWCLRAGLIRDCR